MIGEQLRVTHLGAPEGRARVDHRPHPDLGVHLGQPGAHPGCQVRRAQAAGLLEIESRVEVARQDRHLLDERVRFDGRVIGARIGACEVVGAHPDTLRPRSGMVGGVVRVAEGLALAGLHDHERLAVVGDARPIDRALPLANVEALEDAAWRRRRRCQGVEAGRRVHDRHAVFGCRAHAAHAGDRVPGRIRAGHGAAGGRPRAARDRPGHDDGCPLGDRAQQRSRGRGRRSNVGGAVRGVQAIRGDRAGGERRRGQHQADHDGQQERPRRSAS